METKLRQLGLTRYEAKVYETLLAFGSLNARKISELSQLPPTAVYPAAKKLVEKGLVQYFSGGTTCYEAIHPQNGVASLIAKKKEELHRLQDDLVQDAIEIFHSKMFSEKKEVIRLTQGQEASMNIYSDVVKRVQKTYYILGWKMTQVADKYHRLHEFRAAVKRGVDVRIILVGPPEKKWSVIQAYRDAGIKIRYMPLDNFSIFVADGKECKITLKGSEAPERYNLQILHGPLAKAMEFYFLEVWKIAQELVPKKNG